MRLSQRKNQWLLTPVAVKKAALEKQAQLVTQVQ
jgi:hypothetical protein